MYFITVCSKKSGDTIAILAARCGQLDVLKFVYTQCVTRVINGVPALPPLALEQADLDGKRPLHEAAQNGHLACLVFLLSRGVNVDSLKRADWYA